ncbi:MAG TPA: pyrroloquinoline quinone biosynthesis peptide chaperone PqqD [Methylococcaceae bacterium]|jgi:pyrroloquinoline quinone biosynthesis protein D|nr:pyrroloquinoline quinone biosynthesis peptide chaperone PqqD [Methylococcaceae bacterium]
MSLDAKTLLAFSPLHRLQWEQAQQRHVILYPEGMVELNTTAAEILQLCDGTRNLEGIVEELERKFETTGLIDDIRELLETALENGWIREI